MAVARIPNSLNMSVAERRHRRIGQEAFWFLPTKNTLDRAPAMMPRLLYERLDDLGLDFCVVYPTAALGWYRLPSDKHRRALCRAYNTFTAEQFRPYGDRIIPAAIIPMYAPDEAIEELEYVSKQLGLRVCMTGSLIRRPIPALVEEHPDAASEAMAKALFFGGVTRRFPELNFGFLEGGVGWACSLYADLIGHCVEDLDDYSRCKITRKEDFKDLYVKRYYFGCEADDPINAWAFSTKALPMGVRLNAFFSSDIGHFDVPDMTEGLPEAYELVEHGLLDENDFRDFTFVNAVRFWGEVNPDFFKETR